MQRQLNCEYQRSREPRRSEPLHQGGGSGAACSQRVCEGGHPMTRREFITLLGGAAAAWPLAARAQQAIPAIGYLSASTPDGYSDWLRAFREGLGQSGYVEGENIVIDYRWAENEPNRLPVLAEDLVRRRVNAIVVLSAPASLAAAKATRQFRLYSWCLKTRLGLVSSRAWRDRAET